MSDYDQHPTNTFVAWANAFAPAEMDMIEAIGDRLTAEKATVAAATQEGIVRDTIRVTQTAWIALTAETKWIYDRVQGVTRSLNDRVYQFDLRGYSEHLQYSVYHDHESGHYDWHVDQGPQLKMRRKLSVSLQLTDPLQYDGCDLQFQNGNMTETAPRERGMLIAFPSYVLHRVTPCTRGTRKAVVAWTTGPQFK